MRIRAPRPSRGDRGEGRDIVRITKDEGIALASHIVGRLTDKMCVNYRQSTEDHDGGLDVSDDTLRRLVLAAIKEATKRLREGN